MGVWVGTLLSSMLFPRVDEGRIVLFHARWATTEGALIGVNEVHDFFQDACRRAGYEPHSRRKWFTIGRAPWDVTAG